MNYLDLRDAKKANRIGPTTETDTGKLKNCIK